ncbi:ATP-binding protein, partial [bacterium endosymbiont of Bathymodiolus sp. 5 South]|uniref:ATP-binding protein n=1 Tax=bacterium endosymbiont of Bathymodiolus sp. 5 South TaxID=1181670 RepID=UPI0010B1B818
YKKVCIFMGANASGKTSLGRMMCKINNYLAGRPVEDTPSKICDKDSNASFEVTYITPETKEIHQLKAEFDKNGLFFESYQSCGLNKTDNLKKTLAKVSALEPKSNYSQESNYGIEKPGFKSVAYLTGHQIGGETHKWSYMFSASNTSTELDINVNVSLLKELLMTFDPSIFDVVEMPEELNKNTYIVKFSNGDNIIVDNGRILDEERFSRGTLESIEVANFISFLIGNDNATLFLDEKMAHSHSELEISMLNLMVEKLKGDSQLFYTSHNYDVLEMNLPSHSYVFMKKDEFVEVMHPEKLGYTKNDRSLFGFVKNDVFGTLPDTTKIEELL